MIPSRRRLLLAAGALSAAPLARAQTRRKRYRIGLIPEFEELPNFRPDLSKLFRQIGWREGADFDFVVTGAKYHALEIEAATARMVAEKPDLILAVGTSVAAALYRRTRTIPIVMVLSGYSVEAGLAESLARPGKNVTGTTIYAGTGVWAKYLELLQSAKPGLSRVGMLMSYTPPGTRARRSSRCIARSRRARTRSGCRCASSKWRARTECLRRLPRSSPGSRRR
jgi:putative tryptophan/tyrosine transport system substrate-binding protein